MADSNPFPVLPQYQGDYLDAQRKMALAQALQQQALTPLSADESGWNQMRIVPRTSALSGIAKIGQALLAGNSMSNAIDAQRQLGQEQWQGMQQMFQPSQSSPQSSGLQQGNNTGSPQGNNSGSQQGQPGGPQGSGAPAPNAMNPAGLPGNAAAMMYLRDPSAYMTNMVSPYYKPTDATLMARQAGLDPSQANAGALAKANNIAPVEGRSGGYTYMPQATPDGKVSYIPQYNQPITEGGMPQMDANGRVVGVQPLPGAAAVTQQQATAKAAGPAQFNVQSGVDLTTGMPTYTTAAQIAANAAGPNGAPSAFNGYQSPHQVAPSLPAGSQDLINGYTQNYNAVAQSAKNAPQDIQALKAIDAAAYQSKTGVGFDRGAYWKSMASVIPGIDPNNTDKVNSDIIAKYSQQIAGRNGGRSDAALENALHSTTNSQMSPDAIHELTPSLIGLRAADIGQNNAAQNWLQTHGNNPQSLGQFQQIWNKTYDPDVYRYQAMSPQQKQQYVQSLPPIRAQQLLQTRQALKQMGAMPDISGL